MKYLYSAVWIILSAILFSHPVLAGDSMLYPYESEQLGSITIRLDDVENISKEHVAMSLVKIADVKNGIFELKEAYQSVGVDLNQMENADAIEKAASEFLKMTKEPEITVYTNQEGVAVVDGVPVGVYLIYVSDPASYEKIAPSLLSIPSWNVMENKMMYEVEAIPKHSPWPSEDVPPTGDRSNIGNYVAMLAAASSFLLVWGYLKQVKDAGLQKK